MPGFHLSITATARVSAEDRFPAESAEAAIAKVKADGLAAFNFTLDDDQDDGRNLEGPATAVLIADGDFDGFKDGDEVATIDLGDTAERSSDPLPLDLTDRATILAALRFYQEKGQGEPFNRSDEIHDLATCGDEVISMDDDGIDDLCERINCAPLPGEAPPESSDAPADPVKAAMLAVLHIAHQAILGAAANVLDREDRKDGEYPALMQASEHIERVVARAEGRA